MLSYTKAILDYKLATQREEKILENKEKLTKIKVYFPSDALLEWRESVAVVGGQPTASQRNLEEFVKDLEKELNGSGISLITKTMNNRYKLAGEYCIRLYYGSDGSIHFPADPEIISKWKVKDFISTYSKILNAYSVSKDYVNRLRERITFLDDEF